MSRRLPLTLLAVGWALVAYVVTAWRSVGDSGLYGDGPDAVDAVAVVLLAAVAVTLVVFVLSCLVRTEALVATLRVLCAVTFVAGATLLGMALAS